MPLLPLRLFILHPVFNCDPNKLLYPLFGNAMGIKRTRWIALKHNMPLSSSMFRTSPMLDLSTELHARTDRGETSELKKCCLTEAAVGVSDNIHGEGEINGEISCLESSTDKNYKEIERRRKIGLANKGKVPWNLGRRHTPEVRELIRQKTIEALRDPKVRKKLSEHPRPHSDAIKAKISSSLRRIWRERLKKKQGKDFFFLLWTYNIAKAAKKGWSDQRELDWDGYDQIKQEIALQHLNWLAEKERLRAQKAAAKAEKLARFAQKRKEREEREKQRGVKKLSSTKRKSNKDGTAVAQEIKLKERLIKIHRKRSITVQVNGKEDAGLAHVPAWQKLDLDHIRKEKAQGNLSLADQIRAAKERAKYTSSKPSITSSLSIQHES